MNTALTFEQQELFCRAEGPEGLLSFLVSRAKRAKRSLAPSASDVLAGCVDAIGVILRSAIETRTKTEYDRVFNSLFPKYAAVTIAISHFATAVIQRPLLEQLVRESICEIEADFRDKGLAAFGAVVRDQAVFTVWTLRKINELTDQITAVPIPPEKKKEDAEFSGKFNIHALRAQFSLDCLNAALDCGQPIYPEVLEQLVDGLRSMVNAYTWARRGLEIRIPSPEPEQGPVAAAEEADVAMMDFAFSAVSEWEENEGIADAAQ
jgi:hypothetical protein